MTAERQQQKGMWTHRRGLNKFKYSDAAERRRESYGESAAGTTRTLTKGREKQEGRGGGRVAIGTNAAFKCSTLTTIVHDSGPQTTMWYLCEYFVVLTKYYHYDQKQQRHRCTL